MSQAGRVAAKEYGLALPQFRNANEAERALFAERDAHLAKLIAISTGCSLFVADFSPESLKSLERWYFDISDRDGFTKVGVNQTTFERCISFYLGEVFARHGREFKWFVSEYAFERGRYAIGVRRPHLSLMFTRPRSLSRANNVRMQSLWREFRSYAP
jgi:hypothetical protein